MASMLTFPKKKPANASVRHMPSRNAASMARNPCGQSRSGLNTAASKGAEQLEVDPAQGKPMVVVESDVRRRHVLREQLQMLRRNLD